MDSIKNLKKLAKFLDYLLGRRPDEFGLVADADGFFKMKEVLKALSEEEGWKHITPAALREVSISLPNAPIEIQANLIRALDRVHLPVPSPVRHPPKLLYATVRRKAYARVLQKGVAASIHPQVLLAATQEMALRIGRRIDQAPVLLTVNVAQASKQRVEFKRYGDILYTAPDLPPGSFTGPPLPKENLPAARQPATRIVARPKTPGSFLLESPSAPLQPKKGRPKPKRDIVAWKENRKQQKRKKKFDIPI